MIKKLNEKLGKTLGVESAVNVYNVMRSLYRLAELRLMDSPTVLIENEKGLLQRHLSKLSSDEILFIAINFSEFYEKQRTETALADQLMAEDFEKFIRHLN